MPHNPSYPSVNGRTSSEIQSISLCDSPGRALAQTPLLTVGSGAHAAIKITTEKTDKFKFIQIVSCMSF